MTFTTGRRTPRRNTGLCPTYPQIAFPGWSVDWTKDGTEKAAVRYASEYDKSRAALETATAARDATLVHVKPAIDSIPNVKVHVVADAAHWPQFEQPQVVNRHMIDFLLGVA